MDDVVYINKESTEGAIKTDDPEKLAPQGTEKNNTICVGHHNTETNTNDINKTLTLLQTTGGKDEPNIVLIRH